MTIFRNLIAALAILAFGAVAVPAAHAGDPQIEAAIAAGEVGERIDGYLGIVGTADAAVKRKVQEVNNKRRAVYDQLAAKEGATIEQVAYLTGEKQIAKAAPGTFIMDSSGNWVKK
ncbi:MAG: YdbL family protein [Hyphomonas sp.]